MGNNTTGMDQGRVIDALQNLYEEAYVDGQNAPNGYSSNQKRDEAVAAAMVSACEPGHAIAGRVILNVEGAKGISFGDEQWETLQVGDVVYSAGMGVGLGQGEPVAWRYKTRVYVQALGYVWREVIETVAPNLNEVAARDLTSLYTHADPGEVERCEARLHEVASLCASVEQERDTLRAQLAERDALLRKIEGYHWANVDPEERARTRAELRDMLSASAEPSAPVEIDHDALVAAVCVLRSQGLGNLSAAVEEARAALEAKRRDD